MELFIFTRKVYEYFAYTIYGKDMDWKFVNGKKSKETVEKFVEYMTAKYGAAAGPSFIWLYVIYQFGRFELTNFRPTSHTNFITPPMLFSASSIKKYEERKTIDALTLQSKWMLSRKISQQEFVKKYGFTFTTTMEKVDRKKVEKINSKYKDPIKFITSTTNQGLDLCEDLTDLYNDKDESCQRCPYQKECKELLKSTNLKLFKLKGYE